MLQNKLILILLRIILIIFILIISIYVFIKMTNLLYPFIFAFLIAYFMNPLVHYFEHKIKFPRYIAVLISISLVLTIISGLLILLINEIINGTQFLANVIPIYFKNFILLGQDFLTNSIIPIYENILLKFNKLDTNNQETILQNLQSLTDTTASTGTMLITNSLLGLSTFISQLPSMLTVIVIIILATFFISNDWNKFYQLGQKKIPIQFKKLCISLYNQLQIALIGFMKAQFILISMTAIIVLIGLIILQVPYAITIALLIGFVDLLPYLGTGIILIPWIIYSFIFGSTKFAIALFVLYIVVLIQRQIMEPKVISSNIGIDPLATLISVFIGYQLIGFFGMIIGPIILVLLNTLYKAGIIKYILDFIQGAKT